MFIIRHFFFHADVTDFNNKKVSQLPFFLFPATIFRGKKNTESMCYSIQVLFQVFMEPVEEFDEKNGSGDLYCHLQT